MASEKQFQLWQERCRQLDESDASRVREEVAAEVDAMIASVNRQREREESVEHFRRALRYRDQLRAARAA